MIKHDDPTSASGHRFELTEDERDAGLAAFFTGPIGGTITVPDGSGGNAAYDVTEDVIPVHVDHVEALQSAIHRAHHAAGRFLDARLPVVAADDA